MRKPQNVNFLERGIRALADSNEGSYQLRVLMANVVIGQFMADGVIRGGTSLKIRYGTHTTRFTVDFDVARRIALDQFIQALSSRLEQGWEDFTGRIVPDGANHSKGVPQEYVMRPYEVKLQYKHHPWCTVRLEVSYDEIGDADETDWVPIPDEVVSAFVSLGFPEPRPVPLMTLPYQIAQKLHGLSEPNSHRVQDLIDVQLIARNESLDLPKVAAVCRRLFANRKMQPWPTHIEKNEKWDGLYASATRGLGELQKLDDAITWANDLIDELAAMQ